MNWKIKLITSLSLLIFAGGIIISRAAGRLYPTFPSTVLVAILLVTLLILDLDKIRNPVFIFMMIIIVFFAITIRLFIFTYPASMIAFDPDTFAISIQKFIQSSTTERILSGYYSEVPLFHVFTAIFTQIANIRVADAMGVWPLIAGCVFPITAAVFSLYFNFRLKGALIAGLLMTVLSNSVTFSYKPIPNLLAAALFYTLIICIYRVYFGDIVSLIPANILLVGITYTHKLHPLIVAIGLLTIFVIFRIDSSPGLILQSKSEIIVGMIVIIIGWAVVVWDAVPSLLIGGLLIFWASLIQVREMSETQSQWRAPIYRGTTTNLVILLILSVVLLFIQWTLITNQAYTVIVRTVSPLLSEPQSVTTVDYQLNYAEPVNLGVLNIFYHHSDKLIVFLLTSIAWLYYFYQRPRASVVLLGFSGVCLALVPFGLFAGTSGGLGAQRALLAFSVLAIAVLSAFLLENLHAIGKVVIIMLVIIQVFSVGFVPDYPNSYREYLTNEEIEAKEFGLNHIEGDIHTDLFYASESILPVTNRGSDIDKSYNPYTDNQFRNFGPEVFQKELDNDKYNVMAFRLDINVYRSVVPGARTLSWSPERTFDSSSTHKRVYDSGGVVYYSR